MFLYQDALAGRYDVEFEIDGLLLPKPGDYGIVLLGLKAVCFGFDGVGAGLKLRKAKSSGVVGLHGAAQAIRSTIVTVAPEIAAPAGSTTEPMIALVVCPCAIAGRHSARLRTTNAKNLGMPNSTVYPALVKLAVAADG